MKTEKLLATAEKELRQARKLLDVLRTLDITKVEIRRLRKPTS